MDLRYPIGQFQFEAPLSDDERQSLIGKIAETPARLRTAVAGLNEEQLDTPYRPEGWTVRQLVHHVPESHMNAYTRFKLALTEDEPTIKPYFEDRWAELRDARQAPIDALARSARCASRSLGLVSAFAEAGRLSTNVSSP